MQHRRRTYLIICAILGLLTATPWVASYVYTPEPQVQKQSIELSTGVSQPSGDVKNNRIEYP